MSKTFNVQKKATQAFKDQKPGTSGLRKPTKTFMQPNYVENFVQACLTVAKKYQKPNTKFRLVLGGDGRYFLKEALLNAIMPICAANGVSAIGTLLHLCVYLKGEHDLAIERTLKY